jgi:hypothetical protein
MFSAVPGCYRTRQTRVPVVERRPRMYGREWADGGLRRGLGRDVAYAFRG